MPTPRNTPPGGGLGFPGEEGYEQGDWADADDMLSGGAPAFSFAELGASVSGVVISVRVNQQTEPGTGVLKTFPNGDPMRQTIITLATGLAEDDDDDGERSVYVKGTMVRQFRAALRAAKVRGVRPGGNLSVTYVADGEPTGKGLNPPKVYEITYTPPKGA